MQIQQQNAENIIEDTEKSLFDLMKEEASLNHF